MPLPLPLFSSKFQPARPTARKKLNFHPKREKIKNEDNDSIFIKLGDNEAEFIKGKWTAIKTDSKGIIEDHTQLYLSSIGLKEENNWLKIKVEVLYDMLTCATIKLKEKKQRVKELENTLKQHNIVLSE